MDPTAAVSVDGLVRRFGRRTVLAGLDLHVPQGGLWGVVGPNGCGKTTLMRCLAGLLAPHAGHVQVAGRAPARLRREGGLAYMPQQGGVYAELTARQNVAFFAALHGLPRAARGEAVARALATVDLEDRADERLHDLSGGMVRRTSLACAVVARPSLLLLDEPTVGVDPALRARLWTVLRGLCSEGATVLVSTHYIDEAARCDGVALMRDGRMLASGAPGALLRRTGTRSLEDAFLALAGGEAA